MKVPKYLIILILIILTYPFIIKYVYVQHNQFEQIPLILRYLNPNFLKYDWVTNINSQFSPRYFFTLYIGSFAKIVPLPIVYFIHYLLTTVLVTSATFVLARKIFRTNQTAILTTIIILYGQKITLGGNDLIGRDFDPSRLAFGLIVFGISLILSNKFILSGILFSIAPYLHPLIGLEIPPIIYLALIICASFQKPNNKLRLIITQLKPYLKSIFIYFLFSGFAIYSYFLSYAGQSLSEVPKDILITIVAKIRLSSHYYPLSFPLIDFLKFFILFLLFIFLFRKNLSKMDTLLINFIKYLYLLIFTLCLIAVIFTLLIPVYQIIILQFFRLTVILYWLMAIIVYGNFFYLCEKPSTSIHKLCFALPIIPFILSYPQLLTLKGKSYLIFIILALVWSITYCLLKSERRRWWIILVPIFLYAILYRHYRFQFQQPYPLETAETRLALWAKDNTPENTIFLIPPYFYTFKLVSERAIIADWMSGPFRQQDIPEWFERIKDISGLGQHSYDMINENEIIEGYRRIDAERIDYLANKYSFNYIVTEKQTKLAFPIYYQNELYLIYQLPPKTF